MSNSNMDDVYTLLLESVSNALELGLHPTKGKDVARTKELSRILAQCGYFDVRRG
jgi:hypothetical protein